ncbi:MAG: hypothetical protein K6G76_03260 [Lachnospiraceae bacterium]|nr:hypothetical protein [Lachnospiraceae bacterium]
MDNSKPKKATLKMKNHTINSLQELRDNFDPETILKKHSNGKLAKWLNQNYYENEAFAVSNIDPDSDTCLQDLCNALGVEYSLLLYFSNEEKALIPEKEKLLSTITTDTKILQQPYLVATSQAELASLLDKNANLIYLCNNTFSIPISVPNKTYIGVGNDVVIENPFTKVQYERAGIIIKNINLPEKEDPNTIEIARSAAKYYGYDDFADGHSSLALKYHEALKVKPLIAKKTLELIIPDTAAYYDSYCSCENAAESILKNVHKKANSLFDPESKNSLAKECSKHYSDIIKSTFEDDLSTLRETSINNNAEEAYNKLCKLINKSKSKLKKRYDCELVEDAEFYEIYDLDYFVDQVDIDSIQLDDSDYEFPDILFKVIDYLCDTSTKYIISDIHSSFDELRSDMDDHTLTFYKYAHREYNRYVLKIEKCLDEIAGYNEK